MTAPTHTMRDKILALQHSMLEDDPIDVDVACPVTHHFAPYVYGREMFLPQGVCLVGKTHQHAHLNNLSLGRILVASEDGVEEIHAPYQFISKPGTKRVGLALTDCIWTTYHPNPSNTTDLLQLEREVIVDEDIKIGYRSGYELGNGSEGGDGQCEGCVGGASEGQGSV